jgi:uncharacterized membrane protein
LIAVVFVSGFGGVLRPGTGGGDLLGVSLLVLLGGILGSLVDSALGAGVQAQYRCSETGRVTERPHTRGVPNPLIKGVRWINNDAVNFLAASTAAGVAGALFAWWQN